MPLSVERFDQRPRSDAFHRAIGVDAFPPWLIRGDPDSDVWWDRVRAWFPELQIVLADDEPVASAWGVPLRWQGTIGDLPDGYTDTLRRAVTDRERGVPADTLVVCAAVVLPGRARTGLAGELLRVMRDLPATSGLQHVLVPVRPTGKASFPLVGIDEYAAWTREDGLPLDPWLRTHVRIGGRIISTAPASQVLRAPVAAWEEWTGTSFRTSGDHVLPGGLGPLRIDLDADLGTMTEGNVWVQHR